MSRLDGGAAANRDLHPYFALREFHFLHVRRAMALVQVVRNGNPDRAPRRDSRRMREAEHHFALRPVFGEMFCISPTLFGEINNPSIHRSRHLALLSVAFSAESYQAS